MNHPYDYNHPPQAERKNGFFRSILNFIKSYFIVVGILSTITSILFIIFIFNAIKIVKEKSHTGIKTQSKVSAINDNKDLILKLKLDGFIRQKAVPSDRAFITQLLGNDSGVYLPELRAQLRMIKDDPRVKGILLDIEFLNGSLADFNELYDIFSDFKVEKKPIYSWLPVASNKSFYLASISDEIALAPAGEVDIPGPVFNLSYFGDAIRKVGVGMEVIRSGKYKSAFEPFVANEPSQPTLEMYQALEKDLRTHIVETVTKGRIKKGSPSEATVDNWFRESSFTAKQALHLGIVDRILYLNDYIESLEDSHKAKTVDFLDYIHSIESNDILSGLSGSSNDEALALIEAVGEITMDTDEEDEGIQPESLRKKLQWAKEDKSIKAVVLRISSPGGSALASDLIWQEVKQLTSVKPVVVSMGSYAASGGYYISAPATAIVALPTTITGSIGVIGMVPNLEKFKEKYGVSFHTITGSNRKSMLDQGQPLSSEDKAILEKNIEEIYTLFINKVAQGRKKSPEAIDAIAQGRVWTGAQALGIGLVDKLGGLKEAYQEAKKLAGLDVNALYEVKRYQKEKLNLMDCLKNIQEIRRCLRQSRLHMKSLVQGYLTKDLDSFTSRLQTVTKIFKRKRVQTLWPGYLFLLEEQKLKL
ncbi:MAG: signal peptide peptidase SppA [Bdellovibrionota bacterium]